MISLCSSPTLIAIFVKRQVLLAVFLLSVLVSASAQISKYSLFALPKAGKSEMDKVSSPNKGSLMYNTDDNQIYKYNGASWLPVHKEHDYGDIKYSVQPLDHSGWYILDGREISLLPNKAQQQAKALGFTTKLPDAKDRVLKHPNTNQSIGYIGGKATTTLTQGNLPDVNFAGSTDTSGDHNHKYSSRTHYYLSDKSISTGENDQYAIGAPEDFVYPETLRSGTHSHNIRVNSGGSNQAFERYQPYLAVNTFIYLGLQ
ncbi:MAG: hypothetical protein ACK5H1_03780 [Tenacibaculum sp.]